MVMRGEPVLTSMPTRPSSSPTSTIATAFSGAPWASTTAPVRPSTIRLKYSAALNFSASQVIGALAVAITNVAIVPATNEAIAAIASAGPARPCFAIWWPSRQVTIDDDSPGTLTRIAVVEPPYCAP